MKLKDKAWVYISLLTLITAVVWLGVTLRATIYKPTLPADTEQLTKELDPTLDVSFFNYLSQRSQ